MQPAEREATYKTLTSRKQFAAANSLYQLAA